MGPDDGSTLRIEVVYCPAPGHIDRVELRVRPGSTLADALRASGMLQRHGFAEDESHVGVWGRVQPMATVLRDRDRVELYRPLTVDPKEARRLRYKRAKRSQVP